MHYARHYITYRAAYWTNGQSDVCLTTPEQAHLTDDELLQAANAEAAQIGLEIGNGRIVVGEFKI